MSDFLLQPGNVGARDSLARETARREEDDEGVLGRVVGLKSGLMSWEWEVRIRQNTTLD
jgi:hypothetical protein